MPQSPQTFILGRASAALAIFAALLGSTAPSPLYPIYLEKMHLSHAMGTAIFAIYAVGTLVSLGLTAFIGSRVQDLRKLVVPGLVVTGAGAIVFATADSLASLLIGRFLNGFGTGIVTGMASVALYALSPLSQKSRAATFATLAFTGGAAGGPLLSSAALALGLAPTLLPFLIIVTIASVASLGLLICSWPKPVAQSHVTVERKPAEVRQATNWALFSLGCAGVGVAWLTGSTLMAIGADLGLHIFDLPSASIAGLIPAFFQLFAGIGQAVCGRVNPIKSIGFGLAGMALVQVAMDMTALTSHGLVILVIICGYGFVYGAAFVGALSAANHAAAPHQRESLISRFYIVGYLSNAVPTLLIGIMIDQVGLESAFWIFSVTLVCVAVLGAISAVTLLRRSSREQSACSV